MPARGSRVVAAVAAGALATAFGAGTAAAAPVTVKGVSTSAKKVISAKAISVSVSAPATVTVSLGSAGQLTPATASVAVTAGTKSIKLTTAGVALAKQCSSIPYTVSAIAGGSTVSATGTLAKSSSCTKANAAATVDVATASRCEFIADGADRCLMPYPSNWYTRADATSATGRRVNFQRDSMIANDTGDAIAGNDTGVKVDPAEWNRNDGFSPTPKILVNLPGLVSDADTRDGLAAIATNSGWSTIGTIGDYSKPTAAVVLVDEATGTRVPVWAEFDMSVGKAARPLIIHPGRALTEGHTYAVALQNMKTSTNKAVAVPAAFKLYRDSLITGKSVVESRRAGYEQIFSALGTAGVTRSNIQLAWDFTVGSTTALTGRMLAIRNDAFAQLGDTNLADLVPSGSSPTFSNLSVTDNVSDKVARRVTGSITVPCYLTSVNGTPCAPGSSFHYDGTITPSSLPTQNGTYQADFICNIPRSAFSDGSVSGDAVAKPPVIYGHGLLGSKGEVNSDAQVDFAQQYGYVYCATNEIGFASEDVATAQKALGDISFFNQMADRTQQGLLNELYLGRALVNSGGLRTATAFQDSSGNSLLSGSRLFYDGNSQGGILGGALTAIAPDYDHAVLGVNGMTYSTLLDRSTDFVTYKMLAYVPGYGSALDRSLGLSLIQDLWDRAEPSGYVNHMTNNPLPNTPAHNVLMQVGLGDFQVANITADTEARSIGARIYSPIVAPGRGGTTNPGWGLSSIGSFPYDGSALVYFDSGPVRSDGAGGWLGNSSPLFANVNPTNANGSTANDGHDPHENPRRSPMGRAMKAGFLQVGGKITSTCNGAVCLAGGWAGP